MRSLRIFALIIAAAALMSGRDATAMTFERIAGPAECAVRTCVAARGEIDQHAAAAFQRFAAIEGLRPGALVVLDSPGGDVLQSLKLGALLRKRGLATAVGFYDPAARSFGDGGACVSACVYAFLGGVERTVSKGARLGVHQVAAPAGQDWTLTAQDGQWLMSLVAVHLSRMGARMELLALALGTPPHQMRYLEEHELVRYALVTGEAARGD